MSDEPKYPFVVHVRRGEGRVNYRMTTWDLIANRVDEFAWRCVLDFMYLQGTRPEAPLLVDPRSNRELALKLPDRDHPLLLTLSLRTALEGQWEEMDAVEIGEQGLSDEMGRARVATLDLVELR
jgi:hypothetical protein